MRLGYALSMLVAALAVAARVTAIAACPGDCDGNGIVTIAELINGVTIALGSGNVFRCTACDRNGDGVVTVDELVQAVGAALDGCPATPTPTVTAPPTPTATALNCQVDGVICTVAGTGLAQWDGDGRPALDTSFYFPIAIAFEPGDDLPLIIDWNNLRLRRINADGTIETVMGTGAEDASLPMDGGLAINTSLHHANDIEYDNLGRFFLPGVHLPIVMRVDTDTTVHIVAGTQNFGNSGDGGSALQADLTVPYGVLPDALGGFYISDQDANVVRYVDPQGVIHTVAGNGTQGCSETTCHTGDGGPGTAATLWGPGRLRLGPDGALYFCENKNHVIRRLHPDGTIDTFAGTGTRGHSGDGGPAKQAQFDIPYDVRFAPNGDLYVADAGPNDGNAIRRIDPNGMISTVVGNGVAAFAGDGGLAATAELFRPSAVIFDAEGSMWIADTGNQRVRRVWHYLHNGAPPS